NDVGTTNGKAQILYLPTHACADLKMNLYKQKVLTGGLGTVYTAYSCCLFYVGRQTACGHGFSSSSLISTGGKFDASACWLTAACWQSALSSSSISISCDSAPY